MEEYINNGISNLGKQSVKSNILSISRKRTQCEFFQIISPEFDRTTSNSFKNEAASPK